MRSHIEDGYISNIDAQKRRAEGEIIGRKGEELVVDFFQHIPGIETRLSTPTEDSGVEEDIGPKYIVDAVSYMDGRPVMGIQITTAESSSEINKKLKELRDHPFLRLPEMKREQPSIPKVLVYMDKINTQKVATEGFVKHPEAAIQVLDSALTSLKFDLTQTKNPTEAIAINNLITLLEKEKRHYLN